MSATFSYTHTHAVLNPDLQKWKGELPVCMAAKQSIKCDLDWSTSKHLTQLIFVVTMGAVTTLQSMKSALWTPQKQIHDLNCQATCKYLISTAHKHT